MNQYIYRLLGLLFLLGAVFLVTGCGGRQAPTAPQAEPAQAAAEAIRLYDSNGDGKIVGSELDAVPAFKSALVEMDTDNDKAISAAEIEARMQLWIETDSKLVAASCSVKAKGKKVTDGTLILEPESFMGTKFMTGRGDIVEGACQPTTENPGDYCAMPVGFYKARIEGGSSGAAEATGIEIYDGSKLYQKSGVFPIEFNK